MPARLIVFSGLDGAGKSTQLEFVMQRLRREQIPAVRVWSRGGYTPGMEWAKQVVRRMTGRRIIPQAGPGARRSRSLSRPLVRRLWLSLAVLDLLFLYAVWMRVQLWRGRCVLADRYWQDSLLDFRLNFPTESVQHWWLWKTLVRLAPEPHVAVLLTIPVAESIRRSAAKHEPFPTPIDQLEARARDYASWRTLPKWTHFDGRQDASRLADAIGALVMHTIRATRPIPGGRATARQATTPFPANPEHFPR